MNNIIILHIPKYFRNNYIDGNTCTQTGTTFNTLQTSSHVSIFKNLITLSILQPYEIKICLISLLCKNTYVALDCGFHQSL